MTLSKKCNPILILIASVYNNPSTPVLPILSDPERSTRWILAVVFIAEFGAWETTYKIKIQWDLVDASFLGVSQTTLLVSPINNKFKASSSVYALCIDKLSNTIWSSLRALGIIRGKSSNFFD